MSEVLSAYRAAILDVPFDPLTTALVIVDLQYGSASREHGYGRALTAVGEEDVVNAYVTRIDRVVVPAVQRLQSAFRTARAPLVFLTFGTIVGDFSDMPRRFQRGVVYWRSLGLEPPYARLGTQEMEVLGAVAPLPSEPCFVKTCASGFTSTPLQSLLRDRGVRTLVICGVTTSYCVESTLRDAADRGFDVVLAEDGCGELTKEMHERGVKGCAAFGRVGSSHQIVEALTAPMAPPILPG